MATFPSPRHLVISLIGSLSTNTTPPSDTAASPANPLQSALPATKKALLTLHILFPNALLPALDLLDRGLVTRFTLPHQGPPQDDAEKPTAVFYVRSAQPQPRHRSAAATVSDTTSYEVRLESWSCSCPAFGFAAFPAPHDELSPSIPAELADQNVMPAGNGGYDWTFGGLTRGSDMPVCKHLLACVLAERCKLFQHLAVEQEVSIEELSGWAAGWGD